MSLFPAYTASGTASPDQSNLSGSGQDGKKLDWLENKSFRFLAQPTTSLVQSEEKTSEVESSDGEIECMSQKSSLNENDVKQDLETVKINTQWSVSPGSSEPDESKVRNPEESESASQDKQSCISLLGDELNENLEKSVTSGTKTDLQLETKVTELSVSESRTEKKAKSKSHSRSQSKSGNELDSEAENKRCGSGSKCQIKGISHKHIEKNRRSGSYSSCSECSVESSQHRKKKSHSNKDFLQSPARDSSLYKGKRKHRKKKKKKNHRSRKRTKSRSSSRGTDERQTRRSYSKSDQRHEGETFHKNRDKRSAYKKHRGRSKSWSEPHDRSRSNSDDVDIRDMKKRNKSGSKKQSKHRSRSRSRSQSGHSRRKESKRKKRSRTSRSKSRSRSRSRAKKQRKMRSSDETKAQMAQSSTSSATIEEYSSNKVFLEEMGLKPESAFRVDRKPDRSNLAFITLYAKFVASYYCSRPTMGLSQNEEQAWLRGHRRKDSQHRQRYHRQDAVAMLGDDVDVVDLSKPVLGSKEGSFKIFNIVTSEFLPVEITASEKWSHKTKDNLEQTSDVNPLGIYDAATEMYLQGSGIPSQNVNVNESSQEDKTESSKLKENRADCIKRRTAEYNRKLREAPNDTHLWLEFVNFQDEAVQWETLQADNLNSRNKRKSKGSALLEKKISVLGKAIESNPKSVELITKKLELTEITEGIDSVKKEWKQLTFLYPNNIKLWKKYLIFVQTHFSRFSVTGTIKAYRRCLEKLRQMQNPGFMSHQKPDNLEIHMIDIFVSQCHFLKQVGHSERALGMFQALIELNLFLPSCLSASNDLMDHLTFMEPFWDSGAPRFGEKGAQGWATVMAEKSFTKDSLFITKDTDMEEEILSQKLPRHHLWHQLETRREENHWLPWRPHAGDDECDDPDRMVLFDDLTPSLFEFTSHEVIFRLLMNFLIFLGIPLLPITESTQQWIGDSFQYFYDSVEVLMSSILTGKQSNTMTVIPKIMKVPCLGPNICSLDTEYIHFIREVFQQCWKIIQEPYRTQILVWWLRFELCRLTLLRLNGNDIKQVWKEVRKLAKSVLKEEENRNNLLVYREYAMLEFEMSGEDAFKVLQMALMTHGKNPVDVVNESEKAALCSLFRKYAELELNLSEAALKNDNEHQQNAVNVLACLGAGESLVVKGTASTTLLLRARKKYHAIMLELLSTVDTDTNMSTCHWESSIITGQDFMLDWIVCFAWFQYLTVDLQAATVVLEEALNKIKPSEKLQENMNYNTGVLRLHHQREELFRAYLLVLSYHVNQRSGSLRILREVLKRTLQEYPNNPNFLQTFVDVESQCSVAGHLWREVLHSLQHHPSPWLAVYMLLSVFTRKDKLQEAAQLSFRILYWRGGPVITQTGLDNKLRRLFEHAASSSQTKHCPVLWRLYMKFEHSVGNEKRCKAVFYRALHECPSAKVLYMDAALYLPGELTQITDLMTEKEIRVRLPLEELVVLLEPEKEQRGKKNKTSVLDDKQEEEDQWSEEEADAELSEELREQDMSALEKKIDTPEREINEETDNEHVNIE